jgi:hypothetical protein
MGRYSYPHVIENGAGEHITFVRVVPGPAGDRLEVENIVTAWFRSSDACALLPG